MTLEQELAAHQMMRTWTFFAQRYAEATCSWSVFEAQSLWACLSREGWDRAERRMQVHIHQELKQQ
jgi:hypothetical protein